MTLLIDGKSMTTNKNRQKVRAKALIHQSELDFIANCSMDYPNLETRGFNLRLLCSFKSVFARHRNARQPQIMAKRVWTKEAYI